MTSIRGERRNRFDGGSQVWFEKGRRASGGMNKLVNSDMTLVMLPKEYMVISLKYMDLVSISSYVLYIWLSREIFRNF
jgi:hypothetical protein